MKAYVLEPDGGRVLALADPTPEAEEVVLRVKACGLCGSDLHLTDFPNVTLPVVPGHELTGEVIAAGGKVRQLRVGERVTVDPCVTCGACSQCRRGRPNLCQFFEAVGVTRNGGFAEYVAVPEKNCYSIPDQLDDVTAALAEPLACVVHGVDRLAAQLGDACLILGAGAIGLMLLQILVRRGVTSIVVVDRDRDRVRLAEQLGATTTLTDIAELPAATGEGFDVVVDATGVPKVATAGFDAMARGGKLLLFGVAAPSDEMTMSPFRIYGDELTVLGSMSVGLAFQPALRLLAAGAVDANALVTVLDGVPAVPEAFRSLRRAEAIKVQVRPTAVSSEVAL